MFIRIKDNFKDRIINLSFVKLISAPSEYENCIKYYFSDSDKYCDEFFDTLEEANIRYLEICKLLEIK